MVAHGREGLGGGAIAGRVKPPIPGHMGAVERTDGGEEVITGEITADRAREERCFVDADQLLLGDDGMFVIPEPEGIGMA